MASQCLPKLYVIYVLILPVSAPIDWEGIYVYSGLPKFTPTRAANWRLVTGLVTLPHTEGLHRTQQSGIPSVSACFCRLYLKEHATQKVKMAQTILSNVYLIISHSFLK